MRIIIEYVKIYAPYIYAVCGLFALVQIYRLWQVRAERRQAVFTLEREKAIRELYHIFSVAMLLVMTMGVTYFFSHTLADAVGPTTDADTPAPTVLTGPIIVPTPSDTPLPVTDTPAVAPTAAISQVVASIPAVTPTARPPTVTPAPAPIVVPASCPDDRSIILRPGDNERVSGPISIVGTARHENFKFYKIEYAPAGTPSFNYLGGGDSPVVNGVLYSFNSTALPNGGWTLRLTVVDQTSNYPPPCQVTIQVQN
jgi:hypothetical protein